MKFVKTLEEFTKNNTEAPDVNEALEDLTKYAKKISEKTTKAGGNGQNILDSTIRLAEHLETYQMDNNKTAAESGFYSSATITLFKKLIDQMSKDDIKNNQIDESLNEKINYKTYKWNGKTHKSKLSGKTSSLKEFIKLIKKIPKTALRVGVPSNAGVFTSAKTDWYEGPISNSDINKIIKTVERVTKEYEDKGDTVYEYEISGTPNEYSDKDATEQTTPRSITIRNEGDRNFASDMLSGKYGSLD